MPAKKTPEKKTLNTYGDLKEFAEGLNNEIVRLGGVIPLNQKSLTLQQKKADILCVIMQTIKFNDEYIAYGEKEGLHIYSPQTPPDFAGGYEISMKGNAVQLTDALSPPFDYSQFIKAIEERLQNRLEACENSSEKISAEKYINQTLGTHQNWFKWLLSCIFDAPKSKQFMDGYSIFDTKQPSQDDSVLGPSYDDEPRVPSVKK